MFQSSDYLAGVSSAPPPDLMNEIGDVVKTEVNTISQDIAQRVADQAASQLAERFALKTELQSLGQTVTALSNIGGTVATHTGQITDLSATNVRLTGAGSGSASNVVLGGTLATTLQNLTNNVLIGSRTGDVTHMRWDSTHRSPIQAIDPASVTLPTLDMNSLFLTYTNTALVANICKSDGSALTLTLKDTNQLAAASALTALSTTVTDLNTTLANHTTPLVRLTGSGTNAQSNAVFGGAPTTLSNLTNNVLIANKSGNTTYMRWNGTNQSPIQAIDDATVSGFAVPSLENNNLFLSCNTTSLIADIKMNNGTSLKLALKDAATFATTGELSTLTGRVDDIDGQLNALNVPDVSGLLTGLSNLDGTSNDHVVVLGKRPDTVTSADTLVCDYLKNVLMCWPTGVKSAIQAIDNFGTTVPTLTVANTMTLGYDATNTGLIARVCPSTGSQNTYTMKIANADLVPIKKDANENVIIGKYSASLSGTSRSVLLCNNEAQTSNEAVLLQWPSGKRSAIQAINAQGSVPTLSLDETMCFGYDSANNALTANIRVSNTKNIVLNLKEAAAATPVYRSIVTVTTATVTLVAATHANAFVVYNPSGSTSGTTQSIKLPTGLEIGVEIEIFNRTAFSVTILPSDATGPLLVGQITSLNGLTKITARGAAIVKVFTSTNGTAPDGTTACGPEYFLIGALTS